MISYCIACYRPCYALLLIEELIRKTSCAYEILLWINVDDPDFDASLALSQQACPELKIIGRSPENIGMRAFAHLFAAARFEIVAQIDDDVIRLSHGIAERAAEIFARHPRVKQLVADVWQDRWTSGSRPPMERYSVYDEAAGLYDGPIDGWFSLYHRSILPLLLAAPFSEYIFIGFWTWQQLSKQQLHGLLCRQFKVLHLEGPYYAWLFGQLDKEISKYRRVDRDDVADRYEASRKQFPEKAVLKAALNRAFVEIDACYPD